MSTRQLAGQHPAPAPDGPSASALERMPPQDIAAERTVLGCMILSKDATGEAAEVLEGPSDFYRPAHATIYLAILDMYGRDEPVDPITLTAELTRSGDLDRVGGAPYLHDLVQQVPSAGHAEHWATVVHERAVFRGLTEAGTRILQVSPAKATLPKLPTGPSPRCSRSSTTVATRTCCRCRRPRSAASPPSRSAPVPRGCAGLPPDSPTWTP